MESSLAASASAKPRNVASTSIVCPRHVSMPTMSTPPDCSIARRISSMSIESLLVTSCIVYPGHQPQPWSQKKSAVRRDG